MMDAIWRRAFGWGPAIPIVTAICTVISVLTAVMLLWLIPGVFKLAKKLEVRIWQLSGQQLHVCMLHRYVFHGGALNVQFLPK